MQITKKHMTFYLLGILVFFLVCLGVFFVLIPTSSVFAVEIPKNTSGDYVIATNPKNHFLNVKNMAPGDKPSALLTVINKGKKDFSFDISAELENGNTLFKELDLTITNPQDNKQLYSGKLSDLKDLNLGRLDCSQDETLNIAVGLPSDAGNEYQGIYTSVKFVLNTYPISCIGKEIIWEPPLEKPDVHVRDGKKIPIKFRVENNGICDKQKHNLLLILSGVNSKGNVVQYTFKVSDASLSWEECSSNQPCYAMQFDTSKYHIAKDTYYTATVKDGDQILGSTRFISGN